MFSWKWQLRYDTVLFATDTKTTIRKRLYWWYCGDDAHDDDDDNDDRDDCDGDDYIVSDYGVATYLWWWPFDYGQLCCSAVIKITKIVILPAYVPMHPHVCKKGLHTINIRDCKEHWHIRWLRYISTTLDEDDRDGANVMMMMMMVSMMVMMMLMIMVVDDITYYQNITNATLHVPLIWSFDISDF